VFERWRGTLFWVSLVYSVVAAARSGQVAVEYLTTVGGPSPAEMFDLLLGQTFAAPGAKPRTRGRSQ